MMKRLGIAFALALAIVAPAHSQVSNGRATTAAPTYLNNSTAPLSLDLTGALRTNCTTGCAAGTFNNNADGVATSAINGQAAAWLYGFNGATWDRLRGTAAGGLWAQGNVASGATDSGNPLKTGGVFNTTNPTLTTGQRGDMQLDARANLEITPCGFSQAGNCAGAGGNAADGVTTGSVGIFANGFNYYFNGTTWDRVRGTTTGAFNIIRDAAGNARGANVNASNQLSTVDAASSATGAAVPANAMLAGARSSANNVALIQADNSVALNMSTATTTQIVALSGSTKIYVTSWDVIANGTTNVTLVTGTGANCATGQTSLTGPYPLTAQAGLAKGSGLGPVIIVPAAQALCVTNSAAVQISGAFSYTQF